MAAQNIWRMEVLETTIFLYILALHQNIFSNFKNKTSWLALLKQDMPKM